MSDTTAVPSPAPDGDGTGHRPRRTVRYDRLTPEERSLRASIAAHESWARTPDRAARTRAAREARWQRYLDQVDPDRTLPPAERESRAEHLRKADLKRMALKSGRTRRARRNGKGGNRG
jgi:hypothetical protein